MTLTYHHDLGLPDVKLPRRMFLTYSAHALGAASNDRYGKIKLGRYIETSEAEMIELMTEYDGTPVKCVLRMKYDKELDLCVVVNLTTNRDGLYLVRTVWLNRHDDKHATLDASRYDRVA